MDIEQLSTLNSQFSIKRYESHKDSGVEWIGEVPAHWKVKRVKDVGIGGLTNGIFKTKDQFGSGLKLVNVTDLYQKNSVINNENLDRVCATTTETNRYCVRDGDIFFVRSSLKLEGIGVSAIFENGIEATVFECHIIRFRPNQKYVFPKFAIYQLNSNEIRYKFVIVSKTVTMTTISQDKISTVDLIYPSCREQTAIAAYLDTKTAQIDRKIDLLGQKAAEYGKLKHSLINETVTRGLDKTVPMKDSGVEWIGEVPAHWEIKRVKDSSLLQSGDSIVSEQIEEAGLFPVYGGNGLRGYFSKYTNDGDYILIGRQGALCGNINYASGKFWASEHAVVAYLNRSIDIRWYGAMLLVMNLNQYSVSAAQPGLAVDRIKRLLLPVPPFTEQRAIAAYLDEKTAQIDSIVATINSQIDKLKELRKTLINDVITGKIKVIG